MNQILLGLSLPYIVSAGIYAARGFRASLKMLIVAPACMCAGAVWAVVPDIPRVLGLDSIYNYLHRSPSSNIFFWHIRIDQTETSSPWYAAGFIVVLLSLLVAAWREIKLAEQE